MFQSFQSFLAYLLALLVVYACLRVFRPAFLRDAGRELRRQFGTFGCVFLFCTVSLLAGRVVSKNILRSPPSPQMIPEWFSALGYDPADTDGDGIPDCWERWTRTNRAEADDGLDPDGDGVDNFGEFWNQCDPMMADTDGDGFSDYVEIAGKAVGKTWYDPIVPASYIHDDPDCNTNGVPDRWEGTGYVYGFTDLNHDGFPDGLTFPEAGGGNYDIEVTVTSSRSALLSWGEGTSKGIVLPPCDGLVVRLRLSGLTDSDVRLSCGTLGDGSEGLWNARMSIRWPNDCGYETEANRLQIDSDSVIDCDAMDVSYRGEVQTTPTRSSGDDVPTFITSPFRRRWLQISASGDGGGCWEHCPGGEAILTVTYTNIAPPFAWSINGTPVPNVSGDTLDAATFREYWNGETPIQVDCEWTNSVEHRVILLLAWASIDYLGHCQPGSTNITGVVSTSSHSHTNATDHLPEVTPESITQYTEYCPPATNLTVKAGWTHNTAMLKIRGLIRILTNDVRDNETDHCIGLVWSKGGSISLYDYLADCCKPFADKFTYYVNGSPCGGTIEYGDEPDKYHPTVFHIELREEDGSETLDRMWIVVNSPIAKKEFNNWYAANADTSWVNTLPKPYAKLQISSSSLWGDGATPVNPSNPDPWNSPSKLSGYLHHDSAWEMRAESATSSHGNQACYDANGDIVLNGIGGGTADFVVGNWKYVDSHIREDVNPYLHALHLDGNPGDTRWNNGISRPCLFQGDYLDKYIERRPIIHPEGE